MKTIERFVTEGSEKADDLAKAGAMLDEGFMAEVRAVTMKQERGEVYVALQYAASFHCLVERMKHRTEWCAEANRCRCMRCGKGSKYMKIPGRCDGPKLSSKRLGKMEKSPFGRS